MGIEITPNFTTHQKTIKNRISNKNCVFKVKLLNPKEERKKHLSKEQSLRKEGGTPQIETN